MNNSGFLFGALVIAFIVFITVRGKLSRYLSVVGIGAEAVTPTARGLAI